jgi:hypothetical protein
MNCILSIDVGIKNLGMCLMNMDTKNIIEWDVSGVPPEHADGLFVSLRKHLDDRSWVLTPKVILIEKQPGQNKRMKTVENFLHAYFIIKIPLSETIIYDARHKIPDVVGRGKVQYRKRKATSVIRCREFLKETGQSTDMFDKSKKKDDLADTVMQALSYLDRKPTAKETSKKTVETPTKLTARKPTESQSETRYSKSNLAWFVKNRTRAENEKDKRFIKDLSRYFTSLDELLVLCNVK